MTGKMFRKNVWNIVAVFSVTLFVSGCSQSTPQPIQKIQNQQHNSLKNHINISNGGDIKAYIDDDEHLTFLCVNDSNCHYKNAKKLGEDYDAFFVDDSGYYPVYPLRPSTKGVKCGVGSLWGWLAIFSIPPFGIEDYTAKHPYLCHTDFTTVDSTLIGGRVIIGLVTFGTPFITGGNLHTVKFDKERFIDAIDNSNIETFKKQLLHDITTYNVTAGIDVIYLQEGDVEESLEDTYERIIYEKSLKDGVLFLKEHNSEFIALDIFKKYKASTLFASIALQVEDIINQTAQNNLYILNYEQIVPYIPKEITPPTLPPVPQLTKSEFETKAAFEQRLKDAVGKREEQIRKLQQEYSRKIFERNSYIDALQSAYKKYVEQTTQKKEEFVRELQNNAALLTKVLFLENISGYIGEDFHYDAEKERLYFYIVSKKYGFKQKVFIDVDAKNAKKIKLENSYLLEPQLHLKKNTLVLDGFELLEPQSQERYKVVYTNINYKPESMTLRVTTQKEAIDKKINNYFKKYKQKEKLIVDATKKEIWYIDMVKSVNARVPQWFTHPNYTGVLLGYGEGTTLEEAKANARKDLAMSIATKVNVTMQLDEKSDSFQTFKEFQSSSSQSSDIKLSAYDYKVYKQEKVDGRWYVALEYRSKKGN